MMNSKFQHSDRDSLTIGGGNADYGKDNGSAIYITNYFNQGSCSANCETYGKHELLSNIKDFKIKRLEIWGFKNL